jgi:hypothetical protein
MADKRQTRTLQREQREREQREAELARSTKDDLETAQHSRRADKAHYLRQKLEDRERSEQD